MMIHRQCRWRQAAKKESEAAVSSAWRRVCCRSSLFSMSHAEAGGLVVGLELLEQQLLNMLEMTSYVYVQNSVVYMYIYTNKFMYINMY